MNEPRLLVYGDPPPAGSHVDVSGIEYVVVEWRPSEDHGYEFHPMYAEAPSAYAGQLAPRAWWVTLREVE